MIKKIIGKIWRNLSPRARLLIVGLTQQKFTVSAAAIVINEAGEVLLLDHVLRPALINWGIPGGFINAGEEPEKAVAREVREETGLELQNIQLIAARTTDHHVEIIFRARATGKPVAASREINRAAWFALADMPEQMSGAQKREIIKLLESEAAANLPN